MTLEALLERFWSGNEEARDRLRTMGKKAAPALPALCDAVGSQNPRLRLGALFVLEGLGPIARPAIPAVLVALRSEDADTLTAAADSLGAIGLDAVPGLIEALDSPDWRVRQAACQALGVVGHEAAAAVPALVERCRDRDDLQEVATRAIWALGRIGDESALEPLAEILSEQGGALGCWIAEVFARFGRRARPFASALRDELHRDDRALAIACAGALVRMRVHEEAAVWALISCLQQGDDDARIEAAMMLGEFGSTAAPALASLLAAERDPNEQLRAQAAVSIAKIRPEYASQT